ncbi:hypothetical protein GBAR_LOCUS1585 [Geodia barretti]|uniref:Uncharacterized protein n=1 Tax=Geodia barretti TaxID=519541 RepID=A0AA35QXD0_GEOBA|nr:hypothetical protein GBAR_LOCUS1585 [Geodia barretti]
MKYGACCCGAGLTIQKIGQTSPHLWRYCSVFWTVTPPTSTSFPKDFFCFVDIFYSIYYAWVYQKYHLCYKFHVANVCDIYGKCSMVSNFHSRMQNGPHSGASVT